jgi:hypothetical protein
MLVHDVEQNSDEWYALRAGIPTASNFKTLVTPKGKKSTQISAYAYALAAEKFTGAQVDAFFGNTWTDRGHEMEKLAYDYYSYINIDKVKKVGFVTSDSGDLGCSPDALVLDDGLLEIKCLKAENHIKCLMAIAEGECPSDYYPQVQGQIMVTERAWCDLLFYHPELPSKVIRVKGDLDMQILLSEQLKAVKDLRDEAYGMLQNIQQAA